MADDPTDQTSKAGSDKLDLSSLSSFSLGPDWVSGTPKTRVPKDAYEDRPERPRGPRRERRERAPRKRARPDRERHDGPGPRGDKRFHEHRE